MGSTNTRTIIMEVKIVVSIAGVPSLLIRDAEYSRMPCLRVLPTGTTNSCVCLHIYIKKPGYLEKSLLWSSMLASQVYMQIIPTPMRISIPMPLKCATKRTTTRTQSSHSSSILGPHWISQLLSATGNPSQKLHKRLSSKTVILRNLPGSSIQLLRT